MDTHNLNAFMLVAEASSFSRAAEKLHITQPAVSKRVAALEQQLGSALFDRIGRRTSLTEAGRALLPHARRISQALLEATQAIKDLSGVVSGQLSIATSHHIGLHRLPDTLRRFSTRYPQVEIDIEFMDSEQAYDLVMQGKAELAVVTLAPQTDPSIIATPLWRDPLRFMVTHDHELARLSAVSLAQLSEHPVILPGLNTYTGQIVKRLFDEHQLQLNVSMATNYLETIRMMAAIGLGWTILPESMLSPPLQALEVPTVQIERQLGYIYHRGRSLSNAASAFIAEFDPTDPDPDESPDHQA